MKTLCRSWLFVVLAGWLSTSLEAQTVIRDTEAAQYIGQNVTVESRVVVDRKLAALMKPSYRWSGNVAGIGVRLSVLPDDHCSTGGASPPGFSTVTCKPSAPVSCHDRE